jgi:hypothetical protein
VQTPTLPCIHVDGVGVFTPTYRLIVIPAKAGIYRPDEAWIPAFAGMTMR